MTVFPDGRKERLHGHNYQLGLAVQLSDVAFANMLPFAALKDALTTLCAEFRERVLIATQNPFYEELSRSAVELEFRLCGQRYVLPTTDVMLLACDNITVEALAVWFSARLTADLADVWEKPYVTGLDVTVSESPGQGATVSHTWTR